MFSAIATIPRILSDIFRAIIEFILSLFGAVPAFLDSSRYKDAVEFFFGDALIIFLMITLITFLVSILRSFFPSERTAKLLSEGKITKGFMGNILAALLGVATPFCSCSAVPVFMGFVGAGIPLGVTFSFLIASPMINEVAVIMLWSLVSWKIALLYVATGLVVAIAAGIVIGKLKMEKYLDDDIINTKMGNVDIINLTWKQRVSDAWNYDRKLLKKIWPYIIIGLLVAAVLHGWTPGDWLAKYVGRGNPFAVPLAVVLGIPLYSNAAATIPIVSELIKLGVPMGTALAFMMAITGLSLPEMIILRKVMKPMLLAVFIGIMAVTITLTGYFFNIILG